LTAVFHLKRSDSVLLSNLTYTDAAIVSPAAFQTSGKDVARKPIGTGPFKFDDWQNGVGVSLEANPNYWGGAPGSSKLIFRPILEDQARVVELMSGGVNFIIDVPPDNLDQIKSNPAFTVMTQPGPHVWWLTLNVTKPPFDDLRVRQAVNYAVNRSAITDDLLKGTASPATGSLPPAIAWAYNSNIPGFDYQPDMARQLLNDAGHGGGVSVVMWVPESGSGMQEPQAMATAIQADLEAVGVHATIQTSEWGAYLKTYQAGMGDTADMAAMSWMVATGDPDILYYPTLHSDSWSPAGFNTGHYKNDTVDALVQQGRTIADRQQRADLYMQVQQLVANDAPWLLVNNAMQTAAMSAAVQGFQLHPSFLLYFKSTSVS
jgi:peptide/nickel transport system substrate-binding protein